MGTTFFLKTLLPSCVPTAALPGDRRARLRTPSMLTSSTYAVRSTIGPLVLAGTDSGEVAIFGLLSPSLVKCIRTAEGTGGPHGVIATAVACHPCMTVPTGSGEDVFYVGHSDGSVKAVGLLKGAVLATFVPEEVEHLGPAPYVLIVPSARAPPLYVMFITCSSWSPMLRLQPSWPVLVAAAVFALFCGCHCRLHQHQHHQQDCVGCAHTGAVR